MSDPDFPASGGAVLELGSVVAELRAVRQRWRAQQRRPLSIGGHDLPDREVLGAIVEGLRGALFPMRLGPAELRQEAEDYYVGHTLDAVLGRLLGQVRLELRAAARQGEGPSASPEQRAIEVVREFARGLPAVRELLDSDVLAAYRGDPAARSVDEVLLCYPGIRAMTHHRIAHCLYRLGVPLVARVITEVAHSQTGIDIHPGATIGPGFFIDHGTGVVIGETAEIGRNVRLYQAVTLGAKRFATDAEGNLRKGGARHPVVEDDVVIYAGATLLGRVTIGKGSVIGGNVWLTHSVPAGSRISQASARDEAAEESGGI